MLLHFKAVPGDDLQQLKSEDIPYAGELLKIVSVTGDVVVVQLSETLSIADHRLALCMARPTEVFTFLPDPSQHESKAKLQELNLDAVDLVNFKAKKIPVWASLFKKPPPVFDRRYWVNTEGFDSFIYIPNCTKYSGDEVEDFNSNAMYTQIMLHAYKLMCVEKKINPVVRLASGAELAVLDVKARHGVRNDTPGERAAGLANSELVDFDDSDYGTSFLSCVTLLGDEHVAKEPARRTVLAKCEYIFAGKMSHTYNQRFVKTFLENLSGKFGEEFSNLFGSNSAEVQACIVGILRAMVMDGFVLEESVSVFEAKVWAANLGQASEFLLEVYCHGE